MKEVQPAIDCAVFVIDDDVSVRASLKSLFESVGFHVQLFESADAFLQSERPDLPCCLVLDVRMPGLSGLEFQSELPDNCVHKPRFGRTGDILCLLHRMVHDFWNRTLVDRIARRRVQ